MPKQKINSDHDRPQNGHAIAPKCGSACLEIAPTDNEASNNGKGPTGYRFRIQSLMKEEISARKSKDWLQGYENNGTRHRSVFQGPEPKNEMEG